MATIRRMRKTIYVYKYFVIIFILIGGLMLYPLINGFYLSLWQKNLMYPAKEKFILFDNFKKLFFDDPMFWLVFKNSLIFTVASVGFEYLLGLSSALLLNSKHVPMKNFFRGIVLLPWIVPIAVNSLNWKWMLLPEYGYINIVLKVLGFGNLARGWLTDLKTVFPTVILVNVWRSFPFFTVVILAALTLIPKDLFEAAQIDGANRWQTFRHITFPGIKGISFVIITLHIVWTFSNFDVIYLLTGGGPLHYTEVLPTYLYQQGFHFFKIGYACSIGVFIFLFLMVTIGFYFTKISSIQEAK